MKKKILTIVIAVCTFAIGLAAGAAATANVLSNIIEGYRKSSDKYLRMFQMMSQWLRLKQEGKDIIDYFEKNNYTEIAIYGMGRIGEAVEKELLGSKVTVKYFIDQKACAGSDGVMVSPDDELETVDVIVVTPISSYGEIKQKLSKKINSSVISIEDVLYEV